MLQDFLAYLLNFILDNLVIILLIFNGTNLDEKLLNLDQLKGDYNLTLISKSW